MISLKLLLDLWMAKFWIKKLAIIATLPSLEEARAKIVGILSSPAQKLVSKPLAPGSKIANLAREEFKELITRIEMSDLNKIIEDLSKLTVVEAANFQNSWRKSGALQQLHRWQQQQHLGGSSRRRKSNSLYFLLRQETKKLMLLKKLEQLLD